MSLYYAAMDLHSNQSVLVLIDKRDRQVWREAHIHVYPDWVVSATTKNASKSEWISLALHDPNRSSILGLRYLN